MKQKAVTITDIAQIAGVSRTAVYTALNAHKTLNSRISDKVKEKILQTVKETGYIPNNAAKSLVSGRTYNVGFVMQNDDWLLLDMVLAFEKQGFMIMPIKVLNSDPECERKYLTRLLSRGVDAIIINRVSNKYNNDLFRQIINSGIALIFLAEENEGIDGSMHVMLNEKRGMELPIKFLHNAGKRRFVIVMEHEVFQTKRIQYLHDALALFPDCQLLEDIEITTPKDLIKKALIWRENPESRPDAIITPGDLFAWLVIESLREVGLRVPQDIQITGIGDDPQTYHLVSLTTVRFSPAQVAQQCVSVFHDWLNKKPYFPRVIKPKLITRESAPG